MKSNELFSLSGRVAIVTGGGSGIGKACALMLADAGASIMVVGRRQQKLDETRTEIEKRGGVCITYAADLTQEDCCRNMVAACKEHFGRVDILINSAGSRGTHGSLDTELTEENLRSTMAADFDSVF